MPRPRRSELARDLAAEALGRLEPDEHDLERADVGFLQLRCAKSKRSNAAGYAASSSPRAAGSAPSTRNARSSTWRTWCGLTPSTRAVSAAVCGVSVPSP